MKNPISIILDRDKFINKYCKGKKWDKNDLTFEQVMEIRNQKEWKEATKEK